MNMHHSEEEQIENLKKWWAENGPSVLFGVALGLAGLFGWHAWNDYKVRHATEASALYTDLLLKMDASAPQDELGKLIDSIRDKYDNTAYGPLASLIAAKLANERNDIDGAVGHLEWVIDHAQQPEITITAKLRISRLYLSKGELDKAESLLNEAYPKAYTAVVEELRGDLLVAKGNPENARQAYERALAASDIAPYTRQFIQNKLDQLTPEPADA